MSIAVFLICLLCLGWTVRLVLLLETELGLHRSSKAGTAAEQLVMMKDSQRPFAS